MDVNTDTVWGSMTGNITDQTDLVDYVTGKDNVIKTWVSEQGYLTSLSLNGYATESWVTSQGYITSIPDTYATKSWVSDQQFVTQSCVSSQGQLTDHQDLNGYATESWVNNQGYITSIPDTFATKNWVSAQGYLTEHQDLSSYALKSEIPSLTGYATESWVSSQQFATQSWVSSQGYLTEHQDLTGYALKSEIPSLTGYVQETNLKTINGESLVGKGDIVIQTTAENIECGPVSSGLFNFSNVNEGLIQIADTVEEINNTKENKKPVFYIDVDFEVPSVRTSYADYMSICAQIKQLGVDNVVLYVRDMSGYICMPDVIEVVSQNYMTITGWAYTNNYRIYNNSSSLFIDFNSFVGYTQLNNNINDVKTWVVNQKYAKKSELKTINGESIVGSGDITIQATGPCF